MTDTEFLKFAHEADQSAHNRRHVYAFTYPQLKRAFEAVAAHEREALDQAIRSVGECGCREWCGCFTPETALNAIRARATTKD